MSVTQQATRNTTLKVLKYQLSDAVRSRWLVGYLIFFLLVTDGLLRFGGDPSRAQLGLVNVVLFVVPLVSLVFGTVYLYNARAFIELLLAQPIDRRRLYAGIYLGVAIPLVLACVVGLAAPFLLHGVDTTAAGALLSLLAAGVALTVIFSAVATLIALGCEDRLRGLGAAIGLWLLLTVVYDGLVLFGLVVLSEHPLERATLAVMLANPIDLVRVALLLRFDGAVLLGYTGAVFRHFFGDATGVAVASAVLGAWAVLPVAWGARVFAGRDF